jgi:hypothetical protein
VKKSKKQYLPNKKAAKWPKCQKKKLQKMHRGHPFMNPHFQVNAKPVIKLKMPSGMKKMLPNR